MKIIVLAIAAPALLALPVPAFAQAGFGAIASQSAPVAAQSGFGIASVGATPPPQGGFGITSAPTQTNAAPAQNPYRPVMPMYGRGPSGPNAGAPPPAQSPNGGAFRGAHYQHLGGRPPMQAG